MMRYSGGENQKPGFFAYRLFIGVARIVISETRFLVVLTMSGTAIMYLTRCFDSRMSMLIIAAHLTYFTNYCLIVAIAQSARYAIASLLKPFQVVDQLIFHTV